MNMKQAGAHGSVLVWGRLEPSDPARILAWRLWSPPLDLALRHAFRAWILHRLTDGRHAFSPCTISRLRHLHLTAAFNLSGKNAKIITVIASIHGIGGHWFLNFINVITSSLILVVNVYRIWWITTGYEDRSGTARNYDWWKDMGKKIMSIMAMNYYPR
jgi:hypothetical protein